MQKSGEKRDHGYILTEFNAIKKKSSEDISDFIKRFSKLYNNLPAKIKPPQVSAWFVFAKPFDSEFNFTLKERKSPTLDQIQTYSLEVEVNFTSTGTLRSKTSLREKRRHRPQVEEENLKNRY